MVTTRMGDHFVLGFAPAPSFLQSQILCRQQQQQKSFGCGYKPKCPVHVHMQKHKDTLMCVVFYNLKLIL